MVFEQIEKLKAQFTDKYVVVDESRPELRRFAGQTGTVKTVNMSGRALVEFDANNNVGWYDIDLDFLKVINQPLPKPTAEGRRGTTDSSEKSPGKKESVPKAGAKSAAAQAGPKPAPTGSTADVLAMARGGAAKPAAPTTSPAATSTADVLAMARGGAAKPAAPTTSPAATSTADILAMARGGAAKPAAPTTSPAPTSTADILAMARGGAAKPTAPTTSPAATSTADVLAMARGGAAKPPAKPTTPTESTSTPAQPINAQAISVAEILEAARRPKSAGASPPAKPATPPAVEPISEAEPATPANGDRSKPAKLDKVADILAYCRKTDTRA